MSKYLAPLRFAGAEWMAEAACRGLNPDLFFPPLTEPSGVAQALRVCARCEVASECLEYALVNGLDTGIWGNRSAKARQAMASARRRAIGPGPERHSSDVAE